MFAETQNFHYRTSSILDVQSAMEAMQQIMNVCNANYAINGPMKRIHFL